MSELLVRSKNGIKLYKFEKVGKNEKGEPKYASKITFEYHGYIHEALWSVDGSCFLILHSVEGLLIIRNYEANRIVNKITCCSKYKDLFNSENVKLIKNVQWSPKNKFIVFFFPYDEQKHSQLGNLLLWSVTYNKVFYSFKIKKKICSNWPIINFTSDDNYFFLLNKFDIYVYDALYLLNKSNNSLSLSCDSRNSSQSDVPKDYVFSWSQSNVTALYISPYIDEDHSRYIIVHTKHNFLGGVFIYKIEGLHNYQSSQKLTNISYYQKGQNVIIYDYIKNKNESANNSSNVFAFVINGVFNVITNKCEHPVEVKKIKIKLLEKKTFDNMDNLNCLWSASGKYVILLVQTNDTTNKSYGYLCNCFFFSLVSVNFTLKKINEQIAQDVKWNKSEDEFLIIEGKSDNTITLYGNDLKAKCKFFSQYKNTIKWCPFGNMIAIGGFGNLAGDISFFYREKNDSVVLINEYREACTVLCDWSNDGMLFMTASTYPRMKVENVFKIYTYEGKLVSTSNFNELYDVRWKNCVNGVFREPPKPKVNLVDSKKNVYKLKTVNADKKDETCSIVAAATPQAVAVGGGAAGVGDASTYRKNSKPEREKETEKGERNKDANKEKSKNNKTGSPVIRKEKQQNSFDLDVNWRNKNNRVKKEVTEKEESQHEKERKKDKRKAEEKNFKKMNEREQADMKSDTNWNDRRSVPGGIDEEKENRREIDGREMEQGDENEGERNMLKVIKELMSNKANAPLSKNDIQIDMANINDAEWERMFEMLEKSEEFKLMHGKQQEGTRNGEFSKLDHRFGNTVQNGDDPSTKTERFTDMNHLDIIQMKRKGEGPFRVGNEVDEMTSAEKGERKNGYPNIVPDFITNGDTEEAGKVVEFSCLQQLQALQALGLNEKQEHNYGLYTPEMQQTLYREKETPFLNYEQAQMKIEQNKIRNNISNNNHNNKNNNVSNNDNERKGKRMTAEEYQEAATKYNSAVTMCYKNALNAANKEAEEARKGMATKAGLTSDTGVATANSSENNLSDLPVNNNENALSNEEYMKRMAQMINENFLNDKGMQLLNKHAMNNNAVNMNVLSKLCNSQKGNLNYLRQYNASQNGNNKITQIGRGNMSGIAHVHNGSTGTITDDSNCDNRISNNTNNSSNVNNSVNSVAMSFVNQENSVVAEEMKNEASNIDMLKQMDMKKEEASCTGTEISSNEDIVNLFKKMLPHAKVNVVAQNGKSSTQNKKNWDSMKNGNLGQPTLNTNHQIGNEYSQQVNFKREVNSNAYFDELSVNTNIRNKEVNPSVEMEKENHIREMLMKQRRLCANMNNTGSNAQNLNKAGRVNNAMNINNSAGASAMGNHEMRVGGGGGGGIQEEQMRLQKQAQTQAHLQSQMESQMHPQMDNSNTNANMNMNVNVNANAIDTKKQLNKLNFYELLKCYYTLNVQQIKIRLMWVNLKIENYGEINKSKIPDSIEKEKSILCKLKEMGDMSEYISMLLKQFFLSNREKYEETLKEFSNVILYQDKVLYEKLNEMIRRHSDKPYIVSFIKNIDNIIEYYWSHNDENTTASLNNDINNGNNNGSNNNNNSNNNCNNSNNNNCNNSNNNNNNGGASINQAYSEKGAAGANGTISSKDLNSLFSKKGNNSGNVNMNVNVKSMNNSPMNLNNMNINNKNNMDNGNIRNGVKNGNKMINNPSMSNHNNSIMTNMNNITGNVNNNNNNNNKTAANNMNMNQFEFQKRLLQQKRQVGNNFANSLPNEEQAGYLINNGVMNYMPKGILPSKVDMLDENKLALMYKMNLNDNDTKYTKTNLMNEADKHRMHLPNEHMHNDVTNCKNENFNRYDADSVSELSSLLHIRQAAEMEQSKKMEKEKTGQEVGRPDEALFAKKYILRDILKNKEQAKREAAEGTENSSNNNNNGINNTNASNNTKGTNTNASANNVNVVNPHVTGEGYLDLEKLQQARVDQHFLKQNLQNASSELTAQLKNLLNVNLSTRNNSQLDAVATYANQINKMYQQTNYVNHMHQTEHGNETFSLNSINTKNEVNKMGLSDIIAKQEHINKQILQVSNGELPNFKNGSSTVATVGGNSMSNRTHGAVNINNSTSMFKAMNMSQNDIFSHSRDCNDNSMGEGLYTRTSSGQNIMNTQIETEEPNLRNDGNQKRIMEDKKFVNESELREYVLNEKNKMDSKMMFLGANKENNNVINANHPLMHNKSANMNKKMNVDVSYDSSKNVSHIFEMRDTKRPDALRDKCWQYVDLKGVVQGPFYLEEMRVWNEMGFFEPMLPVRCCDMDRFVALNKLFPPPVKPFTTIPKPQPMLQWEEDIL